MVELFKNFIKMEKTLIVVVIIFIIIGCKANSVIIDNNNVHVNTIDITYEIVKIDSINGIYIIYALQNKEYYKILSRKTNTTNNCQKIEVDKYYYFSLQSLFNEGEVNGIEISREVLPHVNAVSYYGTTFSIEPDSITNIYKSVNLSGLCLIK